VIQQGFITTESDYDLYSWDYTQDLEWRNYKEAPFNMVNGIGYLYANQVNTELAFMGEVRTADRSYALQCEVSDDPSHPYEFPGWNLFGNPFLCDAYLSTEATGMAFYRMNLDGTGFETAVGAIHPMEGFFAKATTNGQTLLISREQPTNSKGKLNMSLLNHNKQVDNAILVFGEGHNLDKFSFRDNSSKVYLPIKGKNYAAVFTEEKGELPIGFKAEEDGFYTLSFTKENVGFSCLHLIDNLTGSDTDLILTPSYSFEARTTDPESRFKLVFAINTPATTESFTFFNEGNLVVYNEGNALLQVIDITGRILTSESINDNATFTMNAAPGVYVIRLVKGDTVKIQKVVKR
jgi:hypothetical protein